ncbi:MAG: DUF4215 domain-containing protein, partial [Deltaproteobacteria bacterium]|nr:DUF4215 domain-containing protein [Deltaproteobacteria bacterium]
DTDACTNACQTATCGDGITQTGVEQCDDGNGVNTDACTNACTNAACGDGFTQPGNGETCDDANSVDTDACTNACLIAVCGDGITQAGVEECDDANTDDTDACTNACTTAVCGDGIVRAGVEGCDDGNTNAGDGCSATCVVEYCGDGIVNNSGETCDDGNTADGDCCDSTCHFDVVGTTCTGAGVDDECNDSSCNGAGVCNSAPANENGSCTPPSPDVCVKTYKCTAGSCVPSSQFITGDACAWLVVSGTGGTGNALIVDHSTNTGDMCVGATQVGTSVTVNGSVVDSSGVNNSLTFGSNAFILNDIVSNNSSVSGVAGASLPGLPPGTSTVAAGQLVAKSNGGFYDTTGLDPRVVDCQNAQGDVGSASSAVISLPSTQSLGAQAIPGGGNLNINATNVGGVNVIDFTKLTAGNDATIHISGGGSANTVMILRIGGVLNTDARVVWTLTGGMTTEHLLIFANGSTCEIGGDNVGSGAILCPNARVYIKNASVWAGQALGAAKKVTVGDAVTFTYVPFIGF